MKACLFCSSTRYRPFAYPAITYNGKRFQYLQCKDCKLVFIDPLPNADDLQKMFPPEYHPEGGEVEIRTYYHDQVRIIKEHSTLTNIADFGCGPGHFLSFLEKQCKGLTLTGIEYTQRMVDQLKQQKPGMSFITYEDFQKNTTPQYDIIRLSHVFIHLTDPVAGLRNIVNQLKPGGLLMVDGPIERNFTFGRWMMDIYFFLRKNMGGKFETDYPPYLVTQTNRSNQKKILEQTGFSPIQWRVFDGRWPFPESLKSAHPVHVTKYILGSMSLLLSKMVPGFGKFFLWTGKKPI